MSNTLTSDTTNTISKTKRPGMLLVKRVMTHLTNDMLTMKKEERRKKKEGRRKKGEERKKKEER